MKIHVDYGPMSDEERLLHEQLRHLQENYQRAAQPIVDRIANICAAKMPRIIMISDEAAE